MTEREHDRCLCKCVRYLINHTEPAAHVGQVLGAGEGEDVAHEGGGRLDPCVGDSEAEEVNLSRTKLEFLRGMVMIGELASLEMASMMGGGLQLRKVGLFWISCISAGSVMVT